MRGARLSAMKAQTPSEEMFESYLLGQGYAAFRYEEAVEGIAARVDYSLECGGATLRFEVKGWEPGVPPGKAGPFDPVGPIRNKIDEARAKFREYKGRGEPCCLVLHHEGGLPISLDFVTIYGAMLGSVGTVFALTPEGPAAFAPEGYTDFLGPGGKMRYRSKALQRGLDMNTTISAIVVVRRFNVYRRQLGIAIQRRELSDGAKDLSIRESAKLVWDVAEQLDEDLSPPQPSVVVYDNPVATVPLTPSFPAGPYDERFGRSEEGLGRLFVGDELRKLEAVETELGIES